MKSAIEQKSLDYLLLLGRLATQPLTYVLNNDKLSVAFIQAQRGPGHFHVDETSGFGFMFPNSTRPQHSGSGRKGLVKQREILGCNKLAQSHAREAFPRIAVFLNR